MFSIAYRRNGVYNTTRKEGPLNKIMFDLFNDCSIEWFRIKYIRSCIDIVTIDTIDRLITISEYINPKIYHQILLFQSKVYSKWKSFFTTEVY